MHWVDEQTLVGQGQEDGAGTHHGSPESIQTNYPRPSGILERGKVERSVQV